MSDHEFFFALRLSKDDRLDGMLDELTTSVLRHVGYADADIAELGAVVRAELGRGRAALAEYDVRFRAHNKEIAISISHGASQIFHTSRRLP